MDRVVMADLFRYGGLMGVKGFVKGIFIPGFRYMYLNRKLHKTTKYSLKWFLLNTLKKRYSYKYGFQIPSSTQIGEGFYIGHFGTIVINGRAKIGKNCNITHGVTIGRTNNGIHKGCPEIGDNVWIGTGSVIVGKIKIGSNVLIAPNSFVNIDVPDNSLVIGNPAQIINQGNYTNNYIEFILD